MSPQPDFPLIFQHLKKILEPFAKNLTVTADTASGYSLDGPYSEKWKRPVYFGGVQIKKNYVSFYLMPVYICPDLRDEMSPELKKHMQGKSCFNFKQVEPQLFKELTTLTKTGYKRFLKEL